MPDQGVVVGIDNGGTTNNATVLDSSGQFLIDHMLESRSRVQEGPDRAIAALSGSFAQALEVTGTARASVRAVGLDTPGPASATGVISTRGAVNFLHPAWRGFDIRGALETELGLPVIYNNDGNAAALYAHHMRLGAAAATSSSVAMIVGTGLGAGVVEQGQVVRGASGMAGELGHVRIPLDGLLAPGQPVPVCNCGLIGDAESIASLTGIEKNLLPYWLSRFPDHELNHDLSLTGPERHPAAMAKAAKLVRGYGEAGDPMALEIFGQQAMALGRVLSIAANFTDPLVYFLGGGVVETAPDFRDWFLDRVREHTDLREEQARIASFALVPDLDMAGARGAAIAAREALGLWAAPPR
jgi:glucokinase